MLSREVYLDQVQAAVEQFPTWTVEEILRWVFAQFTGHDADVFIDDIRSDMRKAEDAPRRNAFEYRS